MDKDSFNPSDVSTGGPDRRAFIAAVTGIGLGSSLLPGVLWAKLSEGAEITAETIACAEEIAGIVLDPAQREQIVQDLKEQRDQIEVLHRTALPNALPPAIRFDPVAAGVESRTGEGRREMVRSEAEPRERPGNLEELSFLPVSELSEMVRRRSVSSVELTRMYLDRIGRLDPALLAVVTLTAERALRQAEAADQEIGRGRYRGPLHGIPWGAKDLLSVAGYPTTWGVSHFRERVIDEDAAVVERLDRAGAVLLAKLSLGELAWGDVWFGGMTRNPWKLEQGASGSSAGAGAATAAGMVGFAVGSETLGSISSPSTRNGVTGLRPTFGRVARTGAMALSWSMDKLGPMCRSAEDCALVFDAIHGPDGRDLTVHDIPFNWNARVEPRHLRIGFFPSAFERDYPGRSFDDATLEVLRSLAATLIPVDIPDLPYQAMSFILAAEAGAAFDEFTRAGHPDRMVRQGRHSWPTVFRAARFIPAVDYINANRLRTRAMHAWAELFRQLDVIVTPTDAPHQLLASNLTGHPALILPNGFREDGTPVSITFLGDLFAEAQILALGHAYQGATDFHRREPRLPR
jgi:Asp-tRNA(Asn)/Glu-tRNA(Gln) amidotransferase A subunit family amidase/ribosomal protein L12E/L44/L45/RPP1/RPP2